MKEAVGNVESIRKAFQDFLVPELRGLAVHLEAIEKRLDDVNANVNGVRDQLSGDINSVRAELHAVESRMKDAIEQAKREIFLTVQLADSEQRHAVLQRKIVELEQNSPH